MRINGKKKLLNFMSRCPSAAPSLRLWAQITEASVWRNFAALLREFPGAAADEQGRVFFREEGVFRLEARLCYELEIVVVIKVGADDTPAAEA